MAKKVTTIKKKSTIKVGGEKVDTSEGVAAGVKKIIHKKGKKAVSVDAEKNRASVKTEKKIVITTVAHVPARSMRSANAYIERQKAKRNKK